MAPCANANPARVDSSSAATSSRGPYFPGFVEKSAMAAMTLPRASTGMTIHDSNPSEPGHRVDFDPASASESSGPRTMSFPERSASSTGWRPSSRPSNSEASCSTSMIRFESRSASTRRSRPLSTGVNTMLFSAKVGIASRATTVRISL